MKTPLRRKLTWILAGSLIFIALTVSGYLFFIHYAEVPVKIDEFAIDSKAALKLNILKQVSKRDGITEWELTAKSATLLKNEDKAILDEVSVVFFTKDDRRITLTAQKGILDTKKHDMIFSGTVVISCETAVLETGQLQYNKKDHIIFTDTKIKLKNEGTFIEADKAKLDLNQNEIILEGNIKGELYENIRQLL